MEFKQPHQQPPHSPYKTDRQALARQREQLGFGDIPTDEFPLDDVSFRDILRAWMRRAIKHSPLEKKLQNGKQRGQRLKAIKDDLKWALQADLGDEDIRAVKKPSVRQSARGTTLPPTGVPQPSSPRTSITDTKSVEINISFDSLPKLPRIRPQKLLSPVTHAVRRLSKRQLIGVGATLGILLISGGSGFSLFKNKADSVPSAGATSAEKPVYQTTLPNGKNIEQLGGWHRVSPPDRNPVFAYADTIDGVIINVSEQPLPDTFSTDKDGKIAELAKSFAANDKITAGDTTVYVGTSAKGPQSAILTKKNLLILIKSEKKIDDKVWERYVQLLN